MTTLVHADEVSVLSVTDGSESSAFLADLALNPCYRPLGRASTFDVAAQVVEEHRPDVVVVEVTTAERLAELVERRAALAGTAVVVVCSLSPEVAVATSFALGARAFVSKPVERGMLEQAVSAATAGRMFVDPRATGWLVELALHGHRPRTESGLTLRQSQIVQLVGAGLTNREVGRALSLSEQTVKTHLRDAMKRLGVHDRWAAAGVERSRERAQ